MLSPPYCTLLAVPVRVSDFQSSTYCVLKRSLLRLGTGFNLAPCNIKEAHRGMRQIFAHLVSDLTVPLYLDFVTARELLAYRLAGIGSIALKMVD